MFLKIDLFCLQEIKKAILSDMTKLGKEAGLKSFEQVKLLFMKNRMQGQCNQIPKIQTLLSICFENLKSTHSIWSETRSSSSSGSTHHRHLFTLHLEQTNSF